MVTIDSMKDKLLTLDQVRSRIESTEPLGQRFVDSEAKVAFAFDPAWAIGLDDKWGTDTVDAAVTINGEELQLTKDAALQAGAAFGLPGKYAQALPSTHLERDLNYWFHDGMGDTAFNVLTTGREQSVAAFAKPSITPYSNRALIETTIEGIQERYGDSEILADYKFNHSLVRTDIRFIIPDALRVIEGGGLADVPAGAADEWAGGLHLTNSLIGKSQTRLETYLFRWWCTNGSTETLPNVGVWNRRDEHDTQDVYSWARASVDEVLGGFEEQFDRLQGLTQLRVDRNLNRIVAEIFDTFKVPVTQRRGVLETLTTSENMNLYVIQNAISQTANAPGLSEDRVDKITRIAGSLIGSDFNSMKHEIWLEGHTAPADARSPYKIGA